MNLKKALLNLGLLFVQTFYAELLQKEFMPGQISRLELVAIENATEFLEFQLFSGGGPSAGLILPLSTLTFAEDASIKPIALKERSKLILKCSKGSYLPVFIQDGGPAGGKAPYGYEGPYYASMWLPYPHVADSAKLHVRYAVKKGKVGKFGIKIGNQGDYRLVAYDDMTFIHEVFPVEHKVHHKKHPDAIVKVEGVEHVLDDPVFAKVESVKDVVA